ncbi:MAG: NTP transferase domain-containing protein [Cyclobacteriaceae bacterium]|nr:NTP transferase domain-containing protein [Cyclobacteriaceae bacterium]
MKAMILAAGLGTRLRPLTESIPKALVSIHGMPIIGIIIRRLINFGFTEIIINLHYLPEKIISYIETLNLPGINFYFTHETEKILDTGGGIKNARKYLNDGEPFLVHNVDVISDIDLYRMYRFHQPAKAMATLAVKGKNSQRSLLFDKDWLLAGWENRNTGERKFIRPSGREGLTPTGFCGIHVISPDIFDLMQKTEVFSIINTYIELAASYRIYGYPVEDNLWMDIGSHKQLEEASQIDPEIYLP